MKRALLFLVVGFKVQAGLSQAFNYLPAHQETEITQHAQFTLSYNEEHEQANWVAYQLTANEVNTKRDRCNCFKEDKAIATGSAKEDDYSSTGFDKGHLSPAADNNISEEANRESFLMSNMVPQLPSFNRKIWAEIEDWVRAKATEFDTVYVVTGPVFANNLGRFSENEITIPGYFYKVLLRFDEDKIQTIGFLIPHVGAIGKIQDYVVPVNAIETITGIDFFPELDDKIENKAESQMELKKWGFGD